MHVRLTLQMERTVFDFVIVSSFSGQTFIHHIWHVDLLRRSVFALKNCKNDNNSTAGREMRSDERHCDTPSPAAEAHVNRFVSAVEILLFGVAAESRNRLNTISTSSSQREKFRELPKILKICGADHLCDFPSNTHRRDRSNNSKHFLSLSIHLRSRSPRRKWSEMCMLSEPNGERINQFAR